MLLVGLWERSYSYFDHVYSNGLVSAQGRLYIGSTMTYHVVDVQRYHMDVYKNLGGLVETFHVTSLRAGRVSHSGLVVSYLTLLPLGAILGILPWLLPSRFSLKTLLIFTTFISLALGLIIYFTKT